MTPTHWNGSHDILNKWFNIGCRPVKYGQCWVFAGVMCSGDSLLHNRPQQVTGPPASELLCEWCNVLVAVMRFLGIPCRVVTNYKSAHDTNCNLIIDVYHADYGVREKRSHDSVW